MKKEIDPLNAVSSASPPESCPVPPVLLRGFRTGNWSSPEIREHASHCIHCQRLLAAEYRVNEKHPAAIDLWRFSAEGATIDNRPALELHVLRDCPSCIRQVELFRAMQKPLVAVSDWFSSFSPLQQLGGAMAFASREDAAAIEVHTISEGLRWTAPIELGRQYFRIESAAAASVLVVAHAAESDAAVVLDVTLERVELSWPTAYPWRASGWLGDVEDLVRKLGDDYRITIAVVSMQVSS